MLLNEAIMGRHSIRSFRPDPVEKSLLLTLADAAQQAPSASNLQAWRFLFITDQQLKEKVDLFSPGLSGKPPVILVICSDMHAARKGGKNSEVYGCLMDASMVLKILCSKLLN
ncbi:MAG: nitroreductase family protein [Blautia obeum]